MSKNIIFNINGKNYKSVPEEDPDGNSCSGCVFNTQDDCGGMLDILESKYSQTRSCSNIIYKEIDIVKGKKKLLIL